MIKSFMICTPRQIIVGDPTKGKEIGWACSLKGIFWLKAGKKKPIRRPMLLMRLDLSISGKENILGLC
jgi:hypothetical protein